MHSGLHALEVERASPLTPLHSLDLAFMTMGPFSYTSVIDAQSNWVKVEEISSTTAGKTLQKHRCIVARYGIPEHHVPNN